MRLFMRVVAPAMIENSLPRCINLSSPPPGTLAVSTWTPGIMDNPMSSSRVGGFSQPSAQRGPLAHAVQCAELVAIGITQIGEIHFT